MQLVMFHFSAERDEASAQRAPPPPECWLTRFSPSSEVFLDRDSFSLSVELPAVDPGCGASLVSGEHHLREPDEGIPLR